MNTINIIIKLVQTKTVDKTPDTSHNKMVDKYSWVR